MSTATSPAAVEPDHAVAGLSTLDRFLPVWIGLAMASGLLLGRLIEVPALLALVYVSLWAKRRYYSSDPDTATIPEPIHPT